MNFTIRDEVCMKRKVKRRGHSFQHYDAIQVRGDGFQSFSTR